MPNGCEGQIIGGIKSNCGPGGLWVLQHEHVTHIKNESHVRLCAFQWLLIVGAIRCN